MVLRKFFTRIGSRFNKEKGFTPLETRGQSEGKEDSLTGFTLNGAINKQEEVMPYWVRDYVIVHEMAHLIEPNHSKAFWNIVYKYRLTERARGYLMAKGLDSEESNDIE